MRQLLLRTARERSKVACSWARAMARESAPWRALWEWTNWMG